MIFEGCRCSENQCKTSLLIFGNGLRKTSSFWYWRDAETKNVSSWLPKTFPRSYQHIREIESLKTTFQNVNESSWIQPISDVNI
jgi:hypothetical protein